MMPRIESIVFLLLMIQASAMGQFTEITSAAGINNVNTNTYDGNGCSFRDFNGDGWDDITLASGNGSPKFYVNNGDDTFTLTALGITNTSGLQIKMMLWADYDNDCDQDLLITYTGAPVQLWNNNGSLQFTDVAATSGIVPQSVNYFGAAWGDINNDGCLDLYLCKYIINVNTTGAEWHSDLYANNCDGTFSDITDTSNTDIGLTAAFQPVFFDYDRDGDQDIYIIIDRIIYSNVLLRNNGNSYFEDFSEESGMDLMIDAMTCTVGDYDNDADLDVYMTNGSDGNHLMRNNDNGSWTDVTSSAGVAVNQICWGSMWLDYNNDSWLDLFVGTTVGLYAAYQNSFFINNHNGTFSDGIAEAGIAGDTDPTFACAMGDLDNDGYYDYVTQNNDPVASSLWKNQGGANHWLSVTCNGSTSNRDGIGTWIECYAGGEMYVRHTHSGENFLGQNSRKEIFGLGTTTQVDSLKLYWLSGTVDSYYNLIVDHQYVLTEGFTDPVNAFPLLFTGDTSLCPGESLDLDAGPFESWLWSDGETTQTITTDETGTYWVTAIDACGNSATSIPLSIQVNELIAAQIAGTDPLCEGSSDGSVSASLDEGNFSSLEWNTGEEYEVLTGLSDGSYWFAYSDENGCPGVSETVSLESPEPLSGLVEVQHVSCYGGMDGTVVWIPGGGTPSYVVELTGADMDALYAGEYELSVTDSHACSAVIPFVLTEPEELVVALDTTDEFENGPPGTASVNSIGGTPPYSISWSNGIEDTTAIDGLVAGSYAVIVTDSEGCSTETTFTIDFIAIISESISMGPEVFPNPARDQLVIRFPECGQCRYDVTDGMGRVLLSAPTTNSEITRVNLTAIPPGMYGLTVVSESSTWQRIFLHE